MIISSELTGKTYKTVEECLKAEEDFHKKKAAEQKAKEEHDKKLDEAYEEAMAACNKYLKLAGITFVDDPKFSKAFGDEWWTEILRSI